MQPKKAGRFVNPLFITLAIVGAFFALTAFVYGLMLLQTLRPMLGEEAPHAGHPLYAFMNSYGEWLLLGELVLLGILTVAAIATDNYWIAKAAEKSKGESREDAT